METPLAQATRSAFAATLCVAGKAGTYSNRDQSRNTKFVVTVPVAEGIRADADMSIDAKRFDLLAPYDGLGEGDEFLEPKLGGTVELSDGRTFELCNGPSGACWRWSDGQRTFLRIHAREE